MRVALKRNNEKKAHIDVKDIKLLSVLAHNARMTKAQLAKRTKLSRDQVEYRLQKLEKSGVIQGYKTVFDAELLGFKPFHVLLQTQFITKESEEAFAKQIATLPFVRALIKCTGKYSFLCAMIATSVQDMRHELDSIAHIAKSNSTKYSAMIASKTIFAKALPKTFAEVVDINKNVKKRAIKLDVTDKKIMEALANNARMKIIDVAKKVGCSVEKVIFRKKRLEQNGIIHSYILAINYEALHMTVCIVPIKLGLLDAKTMQTIRSSVRQCTHCMWAAECVGTHDMLLFLCVEDIDNLHRTITSIVGNNTSAEYDVLIANKEYVYSYLPKKFVND